MKRYYQFCNGKQAVGDIVLLDRASDFVQKHERKTVNLQISKISKHISYFEFEDEYGTIGGTNDDEYGMV